MSEPKISLLFLLAFNAVSAIGGGVALMAGSVEQLAWLEHNDFPSLYFPGVILMAIVGGSALIALIASYKRAQGWQLACITSGVIMLMWIVGEVASIHVFHFLQLVYLITGVAVVWLTDRYMSDKRT